MFIKQISIFVENTPGRVISIIRTLEAQNIDIRALSLSDTSDFGILRLIVDRPQDAVKALREAHLTVSLTSVIAIGIEDQPGAFAKAMRVLADHSIGVEYMYAFVSKADETAFVILRVEPITRAAEILLRNGFELLQDQNIY